MGRNARGVADDGRATRRGPEPPVRDGERAHGLVVVAATGLAALACVTNFALGQARAGVYAAIIGLLAFGAGLAWLAMDRRRIRDAERDWLTGHR